jgi:predicted ATPase
VIAQLERASGFARDDSAAAKLAKLEELLMPTSPSAEEVALIAELLSIPLSECYPVVTLSSERKKEKTFDALLCQVEALARGGPVLIVYEDAHWIDPSSRELLDLLVDRICKLPVLVVITFRSEFEPPWTGESHVSVMVLNRLGRSDGMALVQRIAGNINLHEDLISEIVDRSDGVPLFVEEVTKAVLEGSAPLAALPQPGLAVPPTLHASLMARLDRLGVSAKEVAQAGAVIGREFGYELLATVTGRSQRKLLDALVPLCQSGLLFQRGTPPTANFTFKHALVQEAAYSTLLRARRRQLHGDVARVLQEHFSDRAKMQPEIIAHHLTEAGHIEPAVHAWLMSGRRSAERSAHREAIQQLRRGLDLLATLSESVNCDRIELDLLIALGTP